MSTALIIFLFAVGAAFVQRVSGFGFGIFIMTVLPYLMPSYGECTTLSGLLAGVTSLYIAIKMHRYLNWSKLWPILLTFIIISFFAVQFVATAGDTLLKRILGVVLIAASIYFFFISEKIHVRPTWPIQIGMGTISGIMGGLFGMQGPPAVLYFLACSPTKEEYMALAQSYFLIGNCMMTIFRAHNGFLTSAVGIAWCYGIVGVLIGTTLGGIVFKHMNIRTLRKVVYAYMAISGLVALIN